jgi:hypothetical protein
LHVHSSCCRAHQPDVRQVITAKQQEYMQLHPPGGMLKPFSCCSSTLNGESVQFQSTHPNLGCWTLEVACRTGNLRLQQYSQLVRSIQKPDLQGSLSQLAEHQTGKVIATLRQASTAVQTSTCRASAAIGNSGYRAHCCCSWR